MATAGLVALPMLSATTLVGVTSESASAVITGNVLSGTPSAMWQTNSEVDALAVANGVVYAGGKFTRVRPPGAAAGSQEVVRNYLAAFNANTGALITTWNVQLNNRVTALEVSPDGARLYIGGAFTSVNGTTRNRVAAVNTSNGALVTGFNPNPNRPVISIAASNANVYLGGDFTTVRGTSQPYLASVTASTGALNTAFDPALAPPPPVGTDPAITPRVSALELATDGSRVLAGGAFQSVDGVVTGGFASLDPTDAAIEQWAASVEQPINTNCQGRVTDILVDGDTAYVTAEGDPPGCYEGTYSARLSDGRMNWNSSCLGATQGLAVAGGVLYKGSHQHDCAFTEGGAFGGYVGGLGRELFLHRYLVGQDVRDGSFVHWYPNTNATSVGNTTSVGPQVMASDGRQVFVGGDFTRVSRGAQAGLMPQAGLVRYGPNGDTAMPEVVGRSYNGDPWPELDPILVSRMPVTVQATGAGTLTIEFPAVIDYDTGQLDYRIYRDGSNTPITTLTARSWPWTHPVLRYDDTGLAPGSTHSYRVDAFDGRRASTRSTAVSGTVRTSAPPPYATAQSAVSPATWWRLGEGSGAMADSGAAGNPGAVQGAVQRGEQGAVSGNSAVTLDGSTGYVTSSRSFTPTPSFSESAWFRTTTTRGGVLMAHNTAQTGSTGTSDRLLAMDNNGAIAFGIGRTALRNQGPTWNDGRWHHVVGTYDSATSTANLYVDGWLQATQVFTRVPTTPAASYLRAGYAPTDNMQLVFGRNFYNRHWPRSDFFGGSLDEVALYDRALTEAQVRSLFASGVAGAGGQPQPSAPVADFSSSSAGRTASFDASGSTDPDGDIASYRWSFGDGSAVVTESDPNVARTYASAGTYSVTLTVTDSGGRSHSVTKQVTVSDSAGTPTESTVIENGSAWRYRYSAGEPESGWNSRTFNAGSWTLGNAVLGFGATTVATNLDTFSTTADRPLAAYFTRQFNVTDASAVASLELTTVADDGAVVYVNGTEVARSNMPSGTITSRTYASSARNATTASSNPVIVNVPVSLLVNGTNTVSVETHLNYRATRDMTFDLRATLTASR